MQSKLIIAYAITILLAGLPGYKLHAQEFTVGAFDGSEQLIEVEPLNEGGILTIKCADNSIHIGSVNYIDTAYLLNKHFLLVTYAFRAGAGIHASKTLILSVRNRTLFESLHIDSGFNEEFMDYSEPTPALIQASTKATIHQAAFHLTGNSVDKYMLTVHFHDEIKLISKPKPDYRRDLTTILTFDPNRNIFYSSEKTIFQTLTIVDAKTKHEANQKINGVFPIINLGLDKYCYVGGEWYEWNSNYLIQQSYK